MSRQVPTDRSHHIRIMTTDASEILQRLRAWYHQQDVPFRELVHEPTRTSEDSARVRGEPLHIGGKALLLKSNDRFVLCVIPADRKLDSKRIREVLQGKFRFASAEELAELTGLVPGSVPPFGHPILPFPVYADSRLSENDRIAFNAGSLTCSHILSMPDYQRISVAVWMPLTAD
jgi:prolyl-tRNA editing enzyme YbaK/EbsC (Cys-tRNA(Pro) deacylase)